MTIPTLSEVKTAVTAKEIAPYEAKITEVLETPGTVTFAESAEIPTKTFSHTFQKSNLSEPGIAALIASITAAGYTEPKVENQLSPRAEGLGSNAAATPQERQVFVSFLLAPASPAPTTPTTPPAGGEDGE